MIFINDILKQKLFFQILINSFLMTLGIRIVSIEQR